jgi:UDP-N-acetylmuramate dehydrogenase
VIEVQSHVQLKAHNTFGISAFAKAYIKTASLQQLKEAVGYCNPDDLFLLGGGSNMLIKKDIERTVIHVLLKGKEIKRLQGSEVHLKAQAGENWHELVLFCIENQLAGMENLSLIPGNVGTAPIQNIGAYGVELKDVFHSCDVLDLETLEVKTLALEDCKFGYRDSIFKNEAKNRYVITSVTFKLTDLNISKDYEFKLGYGAIQTELEQLEGELSLEKVSQAVINIRSSKLPDPKVIGNSGSFFKNPVIFLEAYKKLQQQFPDMPCYKLDEQRVKVPAGWLIDQCGLKGKRFGDAGIHDKQALVLVNHGNATGEEILNVAEKVQQAVLEKFNISIEMEVNLIDL